MDSTFEHDSVRQRMRSHEMYTIGTCDAVVNGAVLGAVQPVPPVIFFSPALGFHWRPPL